LSLQMLASSLFKRHLNKKRSFHALPFIINQNTFKIGYENTDLI